MLQPSNSNRQQSAATGDRPDVDKPIPVTKPYLPSREKLDRYIDGIYERGWLTNNGPLVQELTRRLEAYLAVENLLLVSNGTLALQIAYRALGLQGHEESGPIEAITTPFTFVATASSLKWEGIQPVFVDIDRHTWCLDPANIEAAISPRTRGIVPVHVFGNACDVDAIGDIAGRHRLPVIYDASHAFGVTLRNESLLKHGDAATLSFHATKLFHTIEGGAIIFKRSDDLQRARKLINFGITGPETIEEIGINAKMNEFQAAMGLCVLDEIDQNFAGRATVWEAYDTSLQAAASDGRVQLQRRHPDASNNYAYFPIVLPSEQNVKELMESLKQLGILTRRYFYPSLHDLQFFSTGECHAQSASIAKRITCVPIFSGLAGTEIPLTLMRQLAR